MQTKKIHPLMSNKAYAFQKGFRQVKNEDLRNVKKEIMTALGLQSRTSWYQRLYGNVEPRVSEKIAIQGIFAPYGITDIWGE